MLMYAQDYDEMFPRAVLVTNSASALSTFTWDQQIMPYVKSNQVFVCPSAPTQNTRCYDFNAWLSGYTNFSSPAWHVTQADINYPSNTVVLAEAWTLVGGTTATNYNNLAQYNMSADFGGATPTLPQGTYVGYTRINGSEKNAPGVHQAMYFIDTFADGHARPVVGGTPPADNSFLRYPKVP